VGKSKYWGAEGGKSDKCMGVFQLLADVSGLPPKVYAYAQWRNQGERATWSTDQQVAESAKR